MEDPMTTSTVSASTSANSAPSSPATKKGIPLRFVTAASLFDGHDAAINIMRRILQGAGVEVIQPDDFLAEFEYGFEQVATYNACHPSNALGAGLGA